jgi:hypothetical protein
VAITSVNLQEGLGDEVEIMIGFSGLQYRLAISVVGVVMLPELIWALKVGLLVCHRVAEGAKAEKGLEHGEVEVNQ